MLSLIGSVLQFNSLVNMQFKKNQHVEFRIQSIKISSKHQRLKPESGYVKSID